jgi:predicted DNA-binding transcriptional regulator YafY
MLGHTNVKTTQIYAKVVDEKKEKAANAIKLKILKIQIFHLILHSDYKPKTPMTNKNILRRNYLIIRRIMRNDFPSKAAILQYLKNHDIEIDGRTFERDISAIRYNLYVGVEYDRDKNGYFLDVENSNDFDKLLYFIGLAENADVILNSLKNKQDLWQYLSVSPAVSFRGVENICVLLQAIRNCSVVNFSHLNYHTGAHTQYTAEPYLLKEFEGRWYLYAFVPEKQAFRTFGLDRISGLEITVSRFRRTEQRATAADRFNDVYGLVYMPEQQNMPPETVRFRCNAGFVAGHFEALPLHWSQTIENNVVSLLVIVNSELENKLLSYGEHIKVLSPDTLRTAIQQRLTKTLHQYENR